jgi:mono/diheme cytochrome c family protein
MKKCFPLGAALVLLASSCSKKNSVPVKAETEKKVVVVDGASVYYHNCKKCHNVDGSGGEDAPSLIKSTVDKERAIRIISKGHDDMPHFEDKLSVAEIAAVSDYIFSIRK